MKLASLKDGGRDGCLIVVNRDLSLGVKVPEIAGTLQQAIENWEQARPALEAVAASLAKGTQVNTFPLNPEQLASPFPRAFQFLDGSVYLHHMEKARKARGAEMPPNYKTEPLMYQGLSDRFIAPMRRWGWTTRPNSLWWWTTCRWGRRLPRRASTSSS
jgi:fumarylacetoacetate (FAA) hydrolase